MAALFLAFAAASGAAALIYEIAWFQTMELALGSTAASVGLLLAAYMGGLGTGGLVFPRWAQRLPNPWRLYSLIELGTGTLALISVALMPLAGSLYATWAGEGSLALRAGVSAACLVPPAFLMGAALPALGRACGDRVSIGLLYTANIAGGALGSVAAGFWLLREFNVAVATGVAAGLNAVVALAAWTMARPAPVQDDVPSGPIPGPGRVHVVIALSGLCALAAETMWTRTLGLLLGSSVYSLSLIVTVFLLGLGAGTWIGTGLRRAQPRVALGALQLAGACGIWWAARGLHTSLPYWPVNPAITADPWMHLELDFLRACWAVLPAALAWGASFPVALAAASPGFDRGAYPLVFAANSAGAIAGALAASLMLVPELGMQRAQQILVLVSALGGGLLLPRWTWLPGSVAGAALLLGVPTPSALLIAHGRYAATWAGKSDIFFAREGANSSVAVSRLPDGRMMFHAAGKIQASNVPRDLRLQRMLGHLTTLPVARPRSVLVIGCGAGITAGAVAVDPLVEQETIVEIEPLVFEAARLFAEANLGVLESPKVRRVADDGRHFLTTSRERFDAITVDPLDPWAKGAASLYTLEMFRAMRDHLNPGGAVSMYVQLFETTPDAVRSAIATFMEVFPHATLWANTVGGRGYDMVLLGQIEPTRIDLDDLERRVDFHGESAMAQSLTETGFDGPGALFATYAGGRADLSGWLAGAQINRDRDLRMQYLAGLGMDRDDAAEIYSTMTKGVKFTESMFSSAEGRLDSLKRAWERGR